MKTVSCFASLMFIVLQRQNTVAIGITVTEFVSDMNANM